MSCCGMGNPVVYRGKNVTWSKGRRMTEYDGVTFAYDGRGRGTGKGNVPALPDDRMISDDFRRSALPRPLPNGGPARDKRERPPALPSKGRVSVEKNKTIPTDFLEYDRSM